MKTYIVGGAVRDRLLGLPVQDRDHVVIGATPDQMTAAGFVPVGRDFPVFLHPQTHEEYALARTERKSGRGYQGFVFHTASNVTLEQDLARRDLTINAMAEDEQGGLIDPYGGQRDLRARILRHVGEAFAEDPVRILRIARFAARFADFTIAPETLALMRHMVASGEVHHLVPERIWQELARGLMEAQPSRMFAVLRDCGALAEIAAELDALWARAPVIDAARLMFALDRSAADELVLAQRFAILAFQAGVSDAALLKGLCQRLRVPGDVAELALLLAREASVLPVAHQLDAPALMTLIERADGLRRPTRLALLLEAWAELARALDQATATVDAGRQRVLDALDAARAVDAGAVVRPLAASPGEIPAAVRAARLQAIAAILGAMP